jgi:hypothetical protein
MAPAGNHFAGRRRVIRRLAGRRRMRKEQIAVIFGEPETVRFLAALRRLKLQRIRKDRQTNQAKQKVRAVLRKIRAR